MSKEKEHISNEQVSAARQVKSDWKTLLGKLSYRTVVNNIPYLAFVALLCVLYITNSHRAIEMQREQNALNKTLKELRWKDMDIKSQLVSAKMETQVIRSGMNIGLKPLVLPAYKVEADTVTR